MRSIVGVGLMLLAVVSPAWGQLEGTFEGTSTARASGSVAVAAVFKQVGRVVTGTVALPGELPTFGGEYLVTGKATPTRIRVTGVGEGGAVLKMNLKITGGPLRGKTKIKLGRSKFLGTTTLTQNVSSGDGSACDAVYQANQALFDDEVLDVALPVCATCHASGLQAESTRFRVDVIDPLATARSMALFVNADDTAASKILTKPLNLIPHGGGVQITTDGPEVTLLGQWVGLVAAAQCSD